MNLLLDTHVLLWAALAPGRLGQGTAALIEDPVNTPWMSAAALWEVAIKRALERPDFRVEPGTLRAGCLSNGYVELPVGGRHVLSLTTLPLVHRDPFDRILLAQAMAEGMLLLTADERVLAYGGPVRDART